MIFRFLAQVNLIILRLRKIGLEKAQTLCCENTVTEFLCGSTLLQRMNFETETEVCSGISG